MFQSLLSIQVNICRWITAPPFFTLINPLFSRSWRACRDESYCLTEGGWVRECTRGWVRSWVSEWISERVRERERQCLKRVERDWRSTLAKRHLCSSVPLAVSGSGSGSGGCVEGLASFDGLTTGWEEDEDDDEEAALSPVLARFPFLSSPSPDDDDDEALFCLFFPCPASCFLSVLYKIFQSWQFIRK